MRRALRGTHPRPARARAGCDSPSRGARSAASGISAASSPALFDRHHSVVPRVHDQGPRTDLRRELRDVQAAARPEQPCCGVGRRGVPEQILVPVHLLWCAARDKEHAEHPAERRIRRRPARADRGEERVFLGVLAAESSPARIPAVENEVGDAVRMSHRVRDGDRGALGDAEQRESLQAHRIDDRFQITDPRLERRIADVRVGKPAAPLVVPNHRVPFAKPVQPVPPHRALPVELEMRQPGCDPDERRAAPVHGVRETRAVRRLAEAHVLLHTRTVPLALGDRPLLLIYVICGDP